MPTKPKYSYDIEIVAKLESQKHSLRKISQLKKWPHTNLFAWIRRNWPHKFVLVKYFKTEKELMVYKKKLEVRND